MIFILIDWTGALNAAGVIGSAVAAGLMLTMLK